MLSCSAPGSRGGYDSTLTTAELKPLMQEVMQQFMDLQPYAATEAKFLDPANSKEIQKRLDNLGQLSEKVLKKKATQNPAFRITGSALNRHFQEMRSSFQNGDRRYARWMLSATPYACASCHTQGKGDPVDLFTFSPNDVTGNALEKADLLFATRNYVSAEKIYTQLIRKFPESTLKLTPYELENVFKKKLTIHTRIFRNFKNAETSFLEDRKNLALPPELRAGIQEWVKQFQKLRRIDYQLAKDPIRVLTLAQRKLKDLTKSPLLLTSAKSVEALHIAGLLYTILHDHPQDELTPSLLFWLGMVDIALNNEFFFSLGSTYLRECADQFSNAPISPRCFEEYENQMIKLYSGSRGLNIPKDVRKDLEELAKKIGIKGRI